MNVPLTVECKIEFRRLAKGRKQMQDAPATPRPMVPPGRVPRVTRWMALALPFEQLLREGHVASYAELARLGHVTHARISQIMNLLYLAPDLQEAILFLPRTRNKKLESRDKWNYQQCCRRIAYKEIKEIRSELKSLCPKRGWRMIDSIQGIRAAAAKYAERHHKPAPPKRQNL